MGFAGFYEDINDAMADRIYMYSGDYKHALSKRLDAMYSHHNYFNFNNIKLVHYEVCPFCKWDIAKNELNRHIENQHKRGFEIRINEKKQDKLLLKQKYDQIVVLCNPNFVSSFFITYFPSGKIEQIMTSKNVYDYDISLLLKKRYFTKVTVSSNNKSFEIESKIPFDFNDITLNNIKNRKYKVEDLNDILPTISEFTVDEMISVLKVYIYDKKAIDNLIDYFFSCSLYNDDLIEVLLYANLYLNNPNKQYQQREISQDEWQAIYSLVNCKSVSSLKNTGRYENQIALINAYLSNNYKVINYLSHKVNMNGILGKIIIIFNFYYSLSLQNYKKYLNHRKLVQSDLEELQLLNHLPVIKLLLLIDHCLLNDEIFENEYILNMNPVFIYHTFIKNHDERLLHRGISKFNQAIYLKQLAIKFNYLWINDYLSNEEKKTILTNQINKRKYSRLFLKCFPNNKISLIKLGSKMCVLEVCNKTIMINAGEIEDVDAMQELNIDLDYLIITDINDSNLVNFDNVISMWENVKIISTPYIFEYMIDLYNFNVDNLIILDENEMYQLTNDVSIKLFNSGRHILSCGIEIVENSKKIIYLENYVDMLNNSLKMNNECDCLIIGNEFELNKKIFDEHLKYMYEDIFTNFSEDCSVRINLNNITEVFDYVGLLKVLYNKYKAKINISLSLKSIFDIYCSNIAYKVVSKERNSIFIEIIHSQVQNKCLSNIYGKNNLFSFNTNQLLQLIDRVKPKVILYNSISKSDLFNIKEMFNGDIVLKQMTGRFVKVYDLEV